MARARCLPARNALSRTVGIGKRPCSASAVAAISPSVAAGTSMPASSGPIAARTTVSGGDVALASSSGWAHRFRFEIPLPPGDYTIEITEDDPSGGVAGARMTDTKTIVIRH